MLFQLPSYQVRGKKRIGIHQFTFLPFINIDLNLKFLSFFWMSLFMCHIKEQKKIYIISLRIQYYWCSVFFHTLSLFFSFFCCLPFPPSILTFQSKIIYVNSTLQASNTKLFCDYFQTFIMKEWEKISF